jgi:hypothetical protein
MPDTTNSTAPSVLRDILTWSESLPLWQRDALRRIIVAGGVTKSDLDELEQLCRSAHGVALYGVKVPETLPLTASHIGAGGATASDQLSLVAIQNLKHVNRIPADTKLTFGSSPGLTVIFGANGAGKSGYARVLKKACQTRGAPPVIYANAHLPKPVERASAEVVARHGATEFTYCWEDETPLDPRLAQVFVFDAATADNYLSTDASTSFTPFGLDVLPKLSQTCDRLKERIECELTNIKARCEQTAAGWSVPAGTPTFVFLNALSAKTKPDDVDAATKFTSADEEAMAELEVTLKANPEQKAKATRASAERITTFVEKCEIRMSYFSQKAFDRLATKITSAVETAAAAKAFSEQRFPNSLLPGTGGELWKKLWDAAREFAELKAYPGVSFPPSIDIAETIRCVLCQQNLSLESKNRFAEFSAFLADESQKLAIAAAEELVKIRKNLEALQPLLPDAKGIEADIGDELATTVNAFAAASDHLLVAVRGKVERHDATPNEPVILDLLPLKTLIEQLRERAVREEAALDPTKCLVMKQQLADLQGRPRVG